MDSFNAAALIQLFSNIDVFLVILVRFLGLVMILPIFTGSNIPMVSKVGFAVMTAYILFTSQAVTEIVYIDNVIGYTLLLIKEFTIGFIIGFVVYLFFTLIYLGGQLIDFQIGFSMVNVFDPLNQIQVPIVGNLFYLIVSLFLVQTGGLNAIIAALFYSYKALPVNTAVILGNGNLFSYILDMIIKFYDIGIKLSLPVMGAILIVDVSLGLLVKAVPQMNVFVVGMPLKLLIGLLVLFYVAPILINIYDVVFNETYNSIMNIIGGMSP